MARKTVVSIEGDSFKINGRPTYPGRHCRGMRVEGLLMNARLVQGVFDDLNEQTRGRWDYEDGPWDPDRNTREFVEMMPLWRTHGLLGFTINLQGGSPEGYSRSQPWHNSAFRADGGLRGEYMDRLRRILDRADELGMAPILGLFYFGQDQRLADEAAVISGVENATDWIVQAGYRNVLIEIANEMNVRSYTHDIIRPDRCQELIEAVKSRSAGAVDSQAGRLLVGASMGGGSIPPDNIIAASDLILLHGNGVSEPGRIREMVRRTRQAPAYRGQPITFNEDDHFDFDADDNNMLAAVGEHAGWGYFDYRMAGEGFDEGYQSVPVNWAVSSLRKRGFFGLLSELTGCAHTSG